MRRSLAVLAVLAMSLLGACGGSDDPAPSSGATTAAADDSSDDSGGSTEALDACTVLSVDEVGTILGGTVTAEEVPGGGCSFDQEDPRAPSTSISGVVGAGGGFDASKGGNVTSGEVEDVAGVGDGAWVAIGTTGGDNQQGQGVAAVGDQLINVAVIQGNGLDAAAVRTMTVDLLTLAASKA